MTDLEKIELKKSFKETREVFKRLKNIRKRPIIMRLRGGAYVTADELIGG